MGGAETLKEVHEGDARFERGGLGNQGEIVGLLYRTRGEHPKPGLAYRHDIRMITKD